MSSDVSLWKQEGSLFPHRSEGADADLCGDLRVRVITQTLGLLILFLHLDAHR